MLRAERAAGIALCNQPFHRITNGRPFQVRGPSLGYGDNFVIAFYPLVGNIQPDQIQAALASVEAITGEILPLLQQLPKTIRDRLHMPDSEGWWRIAFHLAWHFPRPFLQASRLRLLVKDGELCCRCDETMVQLHGTRGLNDVLPGLIYSELKRDLCTSSEVAVGVIIDALERHVKTESSASTEAMVMSAGQRRAFDRIRSELLVATQMPGPSVECKLLKLADSFSTPPASVWASLEVEDCAGRDLTLSRWNAMQEVALIRGPATDWFCELAERAGDSLPVYILDFPILFDDVQRGFSGPSPVMNRGPLERWVGFVLATLKRYGHEALRITWGTGEGPLSYGLATLDRDLCAASVLAIDLARLTTAAGEAANRERTSCSPFSVPSLEEQGFKCTQGTPLAPSPPERYTMGQLLEDLRRFGENYHQSADELRKNRHAALQQVDRLNQGALVSRARAFLESVPGFSELRALAQSMWGDEVSYTVGLRIVDILVQQASGNLSVGAVRALTLAEAASRLTTTPARDRLSPHLDDTVRQQIADAPKKPKPDWVAEQSLEAAAASSVSQPAVEVLAHVAPPQRARLRREPSRDAIIVYRYWFASNCVLSERKTQKQLAQDSELMKLLGRKVDQGTISRCLKQVRDWIEAGNVLPSLPEPPSAKPKPMDPGSIELGPNREHRPKHLRNRRTSLNNE
jgi:hypothetical protein